MKQFALSLLIYGALVLQTSVAAEITIAGFSPNFLILGVIAAFLSFEGTVVILWSAMIGLLSDCLNSGPLGIDLAIFTLTTMLFQQLRKERRKISIVAFVVSVFLVAFSILLASTTVRIALFGNPHDAFTRLENIAGAALYTATLGAIFLLLFRFTIRLFQQDSTFTKGTSNRWRMLTP